MSDAPDYTGRQLGTWRLIRVLGTGAFGSVYLAQNPLIDREAAVKVLHPHLVPNQTIRRRFFDEARAASQARLEGDEGAHPGVVQIFDGDDGSSNSEGLCYIVMERLVGKTLHEVLAEQGPLSAADTAALGAVLADTLAAVHRRGVVHRDLKPENIFLLQGDPRRPKILDFGIAKLRESGQGTVPGTVLGTPVYMSPEQGQGLPELDGRSDLYSLGVILFECCTASVPFDGSNYRQILFRHLTAPIPDLIDLAPDTPDSLASIIRDLLAKERTGRPSALAARDCLRDAITARPALAPLPSAPPPRLTPQEPAPPRPTPTPVPPTEVWPLAPPRRRRALLLLAAAVPLCLGGAVLLLRRPSASTQPGPPPVGDPPRVTPQPKEKPRPQERLAPVPPRLPEGLVTLPQGGTALSRSHVSIGEFRRFVEAERVTRPGMDRWPWDLSRPLPAALPINNIGRDLATRYCRWLLGEMGRLPRQGELAGASLPAGRFPDLTEDGDAAGLRSFRCAMNWIRTPTP